MRFKLTSAEKNGHTKSSKKDKRSRHEKQKSPAECKAQAVKRLNMPMKTLASWVQRANASKLPKTTNTIENWLI